MLEVAVTMDQSGVVCHWTALAERLFGFSAGDAVGQRLGDLIVPAPVRRFHEAGLRRYVETREPHCVGQVLELGALHQAGHSVPIQMKIVPREESGQLFFDAHMASFSG